MNKYEVKTTFTLDEILGNDAYAETFALMGEDSLCSEYHLDNYNAFFPSANYPIYNELFEKVHAKYGSLVCVVIKGEVTLSHDSSIISERFYKFLIKVLNKIMDTEEFYLNVIKIYQDNLSKLMDKVKGKSINELIFNDTPQTDNGVLKGDSYATNYTKTINETESDMKSPIERIKDIQESLKNVWADWTHKFRNIFIEMEEGYYDE